MAALSRSSSSTMAAAPTTIRQPPHGADSPVSSASGTPTTASSPVSPRRDPALLHAAFSGRQLRPPRCPIYTPAVLRPTERPSRYSHAKRDSTMSIATQGLTTPPLSHQSSSADDSSGSSSDSIDRLVPHMGPDTPVAGLSRIITSEWMDERDEDVTGEPTRDHWKPDSATPNCEQPACNQAFTLINRRHHCRRCGNLYCGPHSLKLVPLDQHARFHTQGAWVRACDSCFSDYKAWDHARGRSRNDSGRGSLASSDSGSGTATPIVKSDAPRSPKSDLVVGSLSRDWSWSTF